MRENITEQRQNTPRTQDEWPVPLRKAPKNVTSTSQHTCDIALVPSRHNSPCYTSLPDSNIQTADEDGCPSRCVSAFAFPLVPSSPPTPSLNVLARFHQNKCRQQIASVPRLPLSTHRKTLTRTRTPTHSHTTADLLSRIVGDSACYSHSRALANSTRGVSFFSLPLTLARAFFATHRSLVRVPRPLVPGTIRRSFPTSFTERRTQRRDSSPSPTSIGAAHTCSLTRNRLSIFARTPALPKVKNFHVCCGISCVASLMLCACDDYSHNC